MLTRQSGYAVEAIRTRDNVNFFFKIITHPSRELAIHEVLMSLTTTSHQLLIGSRSGALMARSSAIG
ncbi:5-profar isomerase [Moniliophthora roreri]|nr:5-profar isomerase [Moniliophthora roreri]